MRILYIPKVSGGPVTVKNGFLYNGIAVTDERNICSPGWHIPSSTELNTFLTYVGGYDYGFVLQEADSNYWDDISYATNQYGFNGRGSGIRQGEYAGSFLMLKNRCMIWGYTKATMINPGDSVYQMVFADDFFTVGYTLKTYGAGCRPIKDSTTLTHGQTGTYTGNDGKVYRTICIGTQEWVADNLCETKYSNGDTIPEVTDGSAWTALTTGARCAYNNDLNNV